MKIKKQVQQLIKNVCNDQNKKKKKNQTRRERKNEK
jgi:hypothetical protein